MQYAIVRPATRFSVSLASAWPAIAAFAIPLALFAASTPAQPGLWDTAELQGVPYILGIAHPTGFPLYVLLGYAFSHIFAVSTVAFRMNLFAGICESAGVAALYLTAIEFGVPRVPAVLAALWFAVTGIVWSHAAQAEVHDLAFALGAFTILHAIRWVRGAKDASLLTAATLFGLGLATHPVAIWLAPALVLAVWLARVKPSARLAMNCAGAIAACLLLYAYLPLRSWYVVAHGADPSAALSGANGLFWNYNDARTLAGFLTEISGSQFGAGNSVLSAWNPQALQADLLQWVLTLNTAYGMFGVLLAIFGLQRLWQRDWRSAAVLVLGCAAAIPFTYAYGAIADPDKYRLLSVWLAAACMGGMALELHGRKEFMRTALVAAALLVWGGETFINNRTLFDTRLADGGRPIITNASRVIPSGAIVKTSWMDATALAYGAYVDGTFGGRTVVAGWAIESSDRYAPWAKRAPVYLIAPSGTAIKNVPLKTIAVIDGTHFVYIVGPWVNKPHGDNSDKKGHY